MIKAGISTKKEKERAFLVGTRAFFRSKWDSEDLIRELERLADTAGVEVVGYFIQAIQKPEPASFIGSGKLEELVNICEAEQIGVVIFNDNLSPIQQKNLEHRLKCKIIDRTGIILDIFAQRALTKEGKLQVELAQLNYMLPRLTRMWSHLSRLGGGIGTRGPGETQLETDRRRINERIHRLKKNLLQVGKRRSQQRQTRQKVPFPVVALVGYTNSGKSTLFEALTGTQTLTENKLFATLDPLLRKVTLSSKQTILLLDTVGFIRELPTQLIAAFKSTLEEIKASHLILHVIDVSHPHARQQIVTVENLLKEMGIVETPIIKVFNKIDIIDSPIIDNQNASDVKNIFYVSALKSLGLENLKNEIVARYQSLQTTMKIDIPYKNKKAISFIRNYAEIIEEKYDEKKIVLTIRLDENKVGQLKKML